MKLIFIVAGALIGLIFAILIYNIISSCSAVIPLFAFIFFAVLMLAGAGLGRAVAWLMLKISVPKGPDLKYLPDNTAEFIRIIIKKMRYRKKVQADVLAELAAHFEDELKDCKSDQEKEEKTQQLIDEFGDVKLLGVLLRRAKKRCRPLWRTVVARTFQSAGILIVCFILYVTWFLTGKPVIKTNYVAQLNRIVCPAADESSNAAPLYIKAADSYDKLSGDISKIIGWGKKYYDANSVEKELVQKWIADNNALLDLVIAGSKKPYYWREYGDRNDSGQMISVLQPYLAQYRNFARLLTWRAYSRAENGRYQNSFEDIKTCYRFGRHLRTAPSMVEQLVGISIEAFGLRTVRNILSDHEINSVLLTTLQKDFDQITADEDFVINYKFEKLSMYDEIQRCFTEDRLGGGHISLDGFRRISSFSNMDWGGSGSTQRILGGSFHILFTHPDKQQSIEMVDRYYEYCEKIFHKTPTQLKTEAAEINKKADEIIKGNLLLNILAPAFRIINKMVHRLKVDVESTMTIIAILRHKEDKQDYPDSLQQLINADYLNQLPIDPFSDKPLIYKKTDDNFILYSLGLNFEDDDGQVIKNDKGKVESYAEQGDWVYWPVQ